MHEPGNEAGTYTGENPFLPLTEWSGECLELLQVSNGFTLIFFFSSRSVAAGLGGAFFVWCHRMYVLGRRKYRNITKALRLDSQ